MSPFLTILRRSLWLILLAAIGGSIYAWWRDRSTATAPEAPQWPPLDGGSSGGSSGGSTTTAELDAGSATDADRDVVGERSGEATDAPDADATGTASIGSEPDATKAAAADRPAPSVVNALVDAPDARPDGAGQTWVEPAEDGSCPDGYPIKANDNSGIFHVPGGRFYDRTKAERCYASAEGAISDGYRQAKS